jgi:NosR/NirI family nitrous oxide reductase transcriptional regulator
LGIGGPCSTQGMTESQKSSPTPAKAGPVRLSRTRVVLLQSYRLLALAAICWLIRDHHVRQRVLGEQPISVPEVRFFWTNAVSLKHDHGPRAGMFVFDAEGEELGYVVRTMPDVSHIVGYCGTTDTMVALKADGSVKGMNVRSSEDTVTHAEDVMLDWSFKRIWNGMAWPEVAKMDLDAEGIEGVSGATLTSMAVGRGIVHRFAVGEGRQTAIAPQWQWEDIGLLGAMVLGVFLAFTKRPGRVKARRWFQLYVVGYVGLLSGDLMAQSLLAGWTRSGIAWELAPAMVLFVAAMLVIPWATKKPLYCQQVCPHGALQEWILRWRPKKWQFAVSPDLDRGLRWLPGMLLGFVAVVVMLPIGFDLAGIEPFDAYLLGAAGIATISVAVVGLIASCFVPKAYCRYGCPTGALLETVRSHGSRDSWRRSDFGVALVLIMVALLRFRYDLIHQWLYDF